MAALLVPSLMVGVETLGAGGRETNIAEIAKKVFPSVVRVTAQNHTRRIATGVVIDKDGYVVTTALMSPRDEKITLTTSDGKTVEAEFLGFDIETQLALLKAKGKGLTAVTLGDPDSLSAGSWVCAVGISPEGTPAVTQGIVSSLTDDWLRLNIWVTPGSSGGPVVNEKGEMVGLLRGVYTEEKPVVFSFRDRVQSGSGYVLGRAEAPSSGMAIAAPADIVKSIAAQIREKGRVEHGWLGVQASLNEDGKLEVAEVDADGPAGQAKLREGDVLLKIDNKDITGPEMLSSQVRRGKPGQDVVLKIDREGTPMDIKVKLGDYTEDEAKKEMELRFPNIFPPELAQSRPGTAPPGRPVQGPRPFNWTYEQQKFIGVYCDPLSPELAQHFGVKEGTAAIVSKLTENGPAVKAGLKVGDVIVRADGKRVESRDDLIDIVQTKKKGDKIKIEVLRDKKPLTIQVTVEEQQVGGGSIGSGDFESFLESWQSYTDAFQKEILNWQNNYGPEIQANIGKLREEFAQNGKKAVKDVKLLLKPSLKRI